MAQVPHDEEPLAPPPLGPELIGGKWKVRVIDADAKITEEMVSGKQVWSMSNRRVMLDFNSRGQPIKDSGGLFGTWLGSLSTDLNIIPIDYVDWRKVPSYRKEMAWKVIQKKFWFDDSKKRKKYVISALGSRCKDLKQRLWRNHRQDTIEESVKARPPLIPEDQWRHFVHIQFTDRAKKARERNTNNRRNLKIPHSLGKKSLARKGDELLVETGKEPNRGELFIASRTRSDGSLVCIEAQICVDKLTQVMNHPIQSYASSSESGPKDAFEEVFGPEHSSRVRCVGRGPTPSKYFQSLELKTSTNAEMNKLATELRSRMNGLEEKYDIMATALQVMISNNDLQGGTKFNQWRKQTSSVSSDQTSTITKT